MIAIRPASIDDLDNVVSIVRSAARHLDEQGILQWDNVYPDRAILQGDIDRRNLFVLEEDGSLAALIALDEQQPPEYAGAAWAYYGKVMVVHRLAIAPEHQGKKYASRMMDFAERKAATHGYDAIRLDAFTQNPAALALYQRRGYRKAGTVRLRMGLFVCYERQCQ